MSTKTALEREAKSLRDLLNRERKQHADMLKAKNDALHIAQAFNPVSELDRSLPHLHSLIVQLVRAHDAGQAIRAAVTDTNGRSVNPRDPYETGASTRGDRSRLESIDERLRRTAEWVSDLLGDRGPSEERAPQCGNPQCAAHGWAQPYTATECATCGLPFGKYHPKLSSTRRRCKTRACPHLDKIGECEHSLLGVGSVTQ